MIHVDRAVLLVVSFTESARPYVYAPLANHAFLNGRSSWVVIIQLFPSSVLVSRMTSLNVVFTRLKNGRPSRRVPA